MCTQNKDFYKKSSILSLSKGNWQYAVLSVLINLIIKNNLQNYARINKFKSQKFYNIFIQ